MDTGKVVISVLAGVAVGALLGVLFASGKETETRRKSSKKSSDTFEDISDKFEDLFSTISEKFDDVKETHGFYESKI